MSTERKNITQPAELWAAAKEQVKRDRSPSLAEWVGDCILANLDEDLREGIPDRKPVGAPPRPKQ